MKRWAIALTAVVALSQGGGVAGARPPRPAPEGTIVYGACEAADEHGCYVPPPVETGLEQTRDATASEIYVRETDGSTRRLTINDVPEWGLVFSPDRTSVAFSTSSSGGSCRAYSMSLDGGEMIPLTPEDGDLCTTVQDWSSDGEWILLVSYYDDPAAEVLKVRPDGTDLTELGCFCEEDTGAWDAQWVDGASRIVMDATVVTANGRYEDGIYSMDGEGDGFRELSDVNVWGDLAIGPKERSMFVATHHWGRKDGEIYELSLDGKVLRRLTDNDLDEQDLLLSPDGSKLLYTVGNVWGKGPYRAKPRILDVRSGRSRRLRLPRTVRLNVSYDTQWEWSPDGTKIGVRARPHGASRVVWARIDGRRSGELIEERPEMALFGWLP